MKQCGLWPVEDNDRSRGARVGADAAPGWGDLHSYTSEHIHWPSLDMGRMGNVFMVMSPNQLYNHGEGPY